jgi:hypothetical protein
MCYLIARFKQQQKDETYRIYVTDSMFYQSDNKRLNTRYYDLINKKVETRNANEIISDVLNKAGLKVVKGEQDRNL